MTTEHALLFLSAGVAIGVIVATPVASLLTARMGCAGRSDVRPTVARVINTLATATAYAGILLLVIGAAPYAATGIQSFAGAMPMAVALDTGSMEPTIDGGDRLLHDAGIGDVSEGDVIVYADGDGTEYAHRAAFHVAEGENWYDRADPDAIGDASSCEELAECPAPHAGWVTKGDANPRYDQAAGRHGVVAGEDIEGRVVLSVDDDSGEITLLSL